MKTSARHAQHWDRGTRWLHLGLAAIVTLQLLNSLYVEAPEPDEPLTGIGLVLLNTHQWLGMAALMIVLLHWAWSILGTQGVGIRHLIPWRREARAQIMRDVRGLLKLRLPAHGTEGGLAGFTHGLGLLAATLMAFSGAILFFLMPENGELTPLTALSMDAHGVVSMFVWAYWGGHIAMALLHQYRKRDGALRNMFSLD